ncbi:hypothetical protein [Paenibacillus oleatilyticus]|uniref:Uncharacterized protein n=1 Tax=Paenibacillus oleatilyticus TaxID=2594886 RepID=A0ABV4V1J5_9BACL
MSGKTEPTFWHQKSKQERELAERLIKLFDRRVNLVNDFEFYCDRIKEFEDKRLPAGKVKKFHPDQLRDNLFYLEIDWFEWVKFSCLAPLRTCYYIQLSREALKDIVNQKHGTIYLSFKIHADELCISDLFYKSPLIELPVQGIKSRYGYKINHAQSAAYVGFEVLDNNQFVTVDKNKQFKIWDVQCLTVKFSKVIPIEGTMEIIEVKFPKNMDEMFYVYAANSENRCTYLFRNKNNIELVQKFEDHVRIEFLEESHQFAKIMKDSITIYDPETNRSIGSIPMQKKWYKIFSKPHRNIQSLTNECFCIYTDNKIEFFDTKSLILKNHKEVEGTILEVFSEKLILLENFMERIYLYDVNEEKEVTFVMNAEDISNKQYYLQNGILYSYYKNEFDYYQEKKSFVRIKNYSRAVNFDSLKTNCKLSDVKISKDGNYAVALGDDSIILWK